MKRSSLSLKWKILSSILLIITIIIVVLGIVIENQQTKLLKNNIYNSAQREAESIAYLDSRALLTQDDLVLSDSLRNLNSLEGFVFGNVLESISKTSVVQLYHKDYTKHEKKLQNIWAAATTKQWEKKNTKQNTQVQVEEVDSPIPGENKLIIFHLNMYDPFAIDNPRFLGIIQLAFSDTFIIKEISKQRLQLILIGLVFWILGVIASLFLTSIIIKPIKILSDGSKKIGEEGNLDYKMPDLGRDELGLLALQFNEMTTSLQVAEKQKAESLVFNEQLRQAQEIQEGMNPLHFLKKDSYEVKGFMRAAKGVGGDYFDFHEMEDGKLAILISDVSGKSISASLVMVIIKTVVATYFNTFKSVRGDLIAKTINEVMCSQEHIDKFATFFFVIFDPVTKILEFTNGGHGPLFVYRAKDKVCTLSTLPGLPIGIDEDNDYKISNLQLDSGDLVAFFTDGINEARDPEANEYGNKRLNDKIIENAHLDAGKILDNLIDDVLAFMSDAPQHDDMTLVIFKVPADST